QRRGPRRLGEGPPARNRRHGAHHDVPRYRLHRSPCPHRLRRLHPAEVHLGGAVHLLSMAVLGAEQAKNPILPAPNEIIWGLLAFLVLLGAMYKFAFPAVTKMMNDRTERIRANLDNAEKVKAEAQSILDDYQRQLADAKNEA